MPCAASLPGQRRTDAGQQPHRLGRQQRRAPPRADHREAARLVATGGDLRQQPVGGEADRHGDADLALDLAREARQHDGGRRAVQRLGAGEVEHRLVDRQRLHQRRQRRHHARGSAAPAATYLAKSGRITTASGQAFSALNIGMALRTPYIRAT